MPLPRVGLACWEKQRGFSCGTSDCSANELKRARGSAVFASAGGWHGAVLGAHGQCHPKCRSDPYNNLLEKPEGLSVDKKQINI